MKCHCLNKAGGGAGVPRRAPAGPQEWADAVGWGSSADRTRHGYE